MSDTEPIVDIPREAGWIGVNDVTDTECMIGYEADGTELGIVVRVTVLGGPVGELDTPDEPMTLVMDRQVADKLATLLHHHHEGCSP